MRRATIGGTLVTSLLLGLAALISGICFAVQSGVNTALGRTLGSTVMAATVSFGAGFVALCLFCIVSGQLQQGGGSLRAMPLWLWLGGGLLGAYIVSSTIFLVPRLGVAAVATLIIAGQLLCSALIDQYGFFGVPVHPVSLLRSIGLGLVLLGAGLVRYA